jgi:hypothetical protein
MEKMYCVAFAPDTPIPVELFGAKVIHDPRLPLLGLNCMSVEETSYGFLKLVAKPEEGSPITAGMALYVPANAVLWMAQGESEKSIGFLAAARRARPQSDPAA